MTAFIFISSSYMATLAKISERSAFKDKQKREWRRKMATQCTYMYVTRAYHHWNCGSTYNNVTIGVKYS